MVQPNADGLAGMEEFFRKRRNYTIFTFLAIGFSLVLVISEPFIINPVEYVMVGDKHAPADKILAYLDAAKAAGSFLEAKPGAPQYYEYIKDIQDIRWHRRIIIWAIAGVSGVCGLYLLERRRKVELKPEHGE